MKIDYKLEIDHFIDFSDLKLEEFDRIYRLAKDIYEHKEDYIDACRGKVLASLFYEPSTRTQFSFQTAMLRLGGQVIGFSDPNTSSTAKGETIRDTVKIMCGYSDIIAMRSPIEGSVFAASLYSTVPIINAGDGGHLHPTQTLTDLFTINQLKGKPNGLKIGICGDLLNGRTVHSLLGALSRFENNEVYLISTPELRIPEYSRRKFALSNNKMYEIDTIEECIGELDIIYMTRIQKERFKSLEDYERQAGIYILDSEKLKAAKDDLAILHPLPKVDEIAFDVDDDKRAKYFLQAEFGMYVRMALIIMMTEKGRLVPQKYDDADIMACTNPRCITKFEKYVPKMMRFSDGKMCCRYCDKELKMKWTM